MPFIKSDTPFIGGRSVVEIAAVFTIIIMTVVVFSVFVSDERAEELGFITDWTFAATVVLGFRNNVLSILFGISFERAINFHKWFAIAALIAMMIHGIDVGPNYTGVSIGVSIGAMAALYLLKDYFFNLFYFFHIISLLFIVPMGFFPWDSVDIPNCKPSMVDRLSS